MTTRLRIATSGGPASAEDIASGAAPGRTIRCVQLPTGELTVAFQDSDFTSVAAIALGVDGLIAFPPTVIQSLLQASHIYSGELQLAVTIYTDADHSICGAVDFTIQCSIVVSALGVATVVLNTVPVPNISYLPVGLGGASANIAASAGGFTVSAQRPAGVACHARFIANWTNLVDVT